MNDNSLVMSGWVVDDRSGPRAILMLSTPDSTAQDKMPQIAAMLGLDTRPGAHTTDPHSGASVLIGSDGWLRLTVAGEVLTRPVNNEWQQAARATNAVGVIVSYSPHPPDVAAEAHAERIFKQRQTVSGLLSLEPLVDDATP